MNDVNKSLSMKSNKGQDAADTVAELSYNLNNFVTLSNYTAQALGNDRFRNFVKLKEFITNPEQIKNISNMDHDDPIMHSKVFKFLKSRGKSLLKYAWGKDEHKNLQFIEMKGKDGVQEAKNELSVGEMEETLRTVKDFFSQQIGNLNDLCQN